jgi:hypothetical protein
MVTTCLREIKCYARDAIIHSNIPWLPVVDDDQNCFRLGMCWVWTIVPQVVNEKDVLWRVPAQFISVEERERG